MRSKLLYVVTPLLLLVLLMLAKRGLTNVDEPTVGVTNWIPRGIGGPVELRPLPVASNVIEDYARWKRSDNRKVARLYTAVISRTNQGGYVVRTNRGDTPVGQSYSTWVTFLCTDSTNGSYQFIWHHPGRLKGDYFKITGEPKEVWVRPIRTDQITGLPELQIEAFQGMQTFGVIAEDGTLGK